MSELETIEATYRIVTPMFIGGANQEATAIRPSSVKGVLRFWWRALQWGKIRHEYDSDEKALKELHEQEGCLFGAAADEVNKTGGQGVFLLRVDQPSKIKLQKEKTVHTEFSKRDASRYLGYGLMVAFSSKNKGSEAGELERSCINEDQEFMVKITFRNGTKKTEQDSVIKALTAIGLLGGLGSRTRRGFGSINLVSIIKKKGEEDKEILTAPKTVQQYKDMVRELMPKLYKENPEELPPYSAFSRHSRVDKLLEGNDPYSVLNDFAKAMLMYRSWGKGGKVLREDSERRFVEDHDWGKDISRPKNFHPRRVVFGLPHNYGKEEKFQIPPSSKGDGNQNERQRRASPLLFHVQRLSEKEFLGVSVFLKATFLPVGEKINAGGKYVEQKIEWDILTKFLDGFEGSDDAQKTTKRFPKKETIA